MNYRMLQWSFATIIVTMLLAIVLMMNSLLPLLSLITHQMTSLVTVMIIRLKCLLVQCDPCKLMWICVAACEINRCYSTWTVYSVVIHKCIQTISIPLVITWCQQTSLAKPKYRFFFYSECSWIKAVTARPETSTLGCKFICQSQGSQAERAV